MSGFDRSRLKGTSLATLKQKEQEHEAKRPSNDFERNYLKIDDGDNTFRFFPFHPDGGGSSYSEAKCVSFLSVKTEKRDDNGKGTGEFEVKRRPVFNGKVHGNLPKDLVEEYLRIAKDIAIPNFTDDEKKQKAIWGKITGQDGIKPIDTWVVYAAKREGGVYKTGLLELKKSITPQLRDLAAQLTTDVQSPDPFSDPDEGICVIINKSGKKLDTEYKATLENEVVKKEGSGRLSTEYIYTPLTDQQIEEWIKKDSLYKMYVNVFKKRDLELQLDGLVRFDAELKASGYPIAVTEYSEFADIAEELFNLVAEDDQKEEKKEEKKEVEKPSLAPKKSIKPTLNPAPKVENKPLPKVSKPVVAQPEPEEEEEVQEDDLPAVEERKTVSNSAPAPSTEDRLAKFKSRLGSGKK